MNKDSITNKRLNTIIKQNFIPKESNSQTMEIVFHVIITQRYTEKTQSYTEKQKSKRAFLVGRIGDVLERG